VSIAQSLLPEFDQEMAVTRLLLERVPEGQAAWKPHEKSMRLGQLAIHLATLPSWTLPTLRQTELDINPPGGPGYKAPSWQSAAITMATFDESVKMARAAMAGAADAALLEPWTFKNHGHVVFTMPRVAVLRSMVFNHVVHHRGQLSVYLRLQDVPLPPMYGPTADSPM
jgi:uncharacterized damage-inducible protein DinB